METWDAIRARRNVRESEARPIAAELGIGSGHSAVGDHDLARRVLGFPEDRHLAHLIDLGYPAGRPLRPLRSPEPTRDRRRRPPWPVVSP